MRRILFTFIIVIFIATCASSRIEAYTKTIPNKTFGQGIVKTTKSILTPIYWTGKGVYKIAYFFVEELLRPFKAIRDKAIDIWGVTSKK